jgi:pSer/pThr/pTyr-binding forkhead associated (FHA) protein
MKLCLIVLTPGKWEGKEIPIPIPQFMIGRDPSCHLRPASALISKRHCVLEVRGNKVFLRDFGSTNGTFLNEQSVNAEVEIHDKDQLRVGPIAFRVRLEVQTPVDQPTPIPVNKAARPEPDADDAAAALLLSIQDGDPPSAGLKELDKDGVPTGSTVMDTIAVPPPPEDDKKDPTKPADKSKQAKVMGSADTSTAAKAILDKYLRRPRT